MRDVATRLDDESRSLILGDWGNMLRGSCYSHSIRMSPLRHQHNKKNEIHQANPPIRLDQPPPLMSDRPFVSPRQTLREEREGGSLMMVARDGCCRGLADTRAVSRNTPVTHVCVVSARLNPKAGRAHCNPSKGKFSQMLDSAEAPRNRTGSHGGIGGVRKVCPRQIAERIWTMFFFSSVVDSMIPR